MTYKMILAATVAAPLMFAGNAFAQKASAPAATTSSAASAAAAAPAAPEAGSMAASSPADLSAADKKFIQKAAVGGMAEVQTAQLAQQKSDDTTVKQFAQKMIDDHTPNNERLMKLASAKGVTPPTELDAMHQKQMAKLQTLSGKKFDTTYLKGQEKDHAVMLKLFETEAKNGHDPDLKQFAETTIPVIESHEHMAESDLK
jgi:putative membrane protein